MTSNGENISLTLAMILLWARAMVRFLFYSEDRDSSHILLQSIMNKRQSATLQTCYISIQSIRHNLCAKTPIALPLKAQYSPKSTCCSSIWHKLSLELVTSQPNLSLLPTAPLSWCRVLQWSTHHPSLGHFFSTLKQCMCNTTSNSPNIIDFLLKTCWFRAREKGRVRA